MLSTFFVCIRATEAQRVGHPPYTYDDFNRLSTSSQNSGQNAYSYVYDRFGNRWQQNVTAGTGQQSSLTFDANNHISSSGYAYDGNGDLSTVGSSTHGFDAEGRLFWTGVTGGEYAYDALGRRVSKGQEDYLLDLEGHPISNYAGGWNQSDIFVGGRHALSYSNSTFYTIHADWLGSERARTSTTGAVAETCTGLPFGEESCVSGYQDPSFYFTGKWHDAETGLDYFGGRHYASTLGRFMSPDWSATPSEVPYATFTNPQTLNLYAIVHDSPVTLADLDGHEDEDADGGRQVLAAQDQTPPPVVQTTQSQDQQSGPTQDLPPAKPSDPPPPPGGVVHSQHPGWKNTLEGIEDAVLKTASDFSAGAGDCLTGRCIPFVHTSFTEWARGSDADKLVDKNSLSYTGGSITGGVVGSTLVGAAGATAAAIADGKNGVLFGRGVNTVFNSSKVRFGWGWQGSATAGRDVIRLGIGAARGTNWWSHIVFWTIK